MELAIVEMGKRCEQNPLLTLKDIKSAAKGFTVKGLFNPAVFKFDKKTWLAINVAECPPQDEGRVGIPAYNEEEEMEVVYVDRAVAEFDVINSRIVTYKHKTYRRCMSHFRLMCSDDGIMFYEPEGYLPIFGSGPLENYGIEDAHVMEIDRVFYLTYTMVSSFGSGVGLIQTRDWKRFDRKGMILPPGNSNCTLFEEKIRDKFYALHSPDRNNIWISESQNLSHWGNHKCIFSTRENKWDSARLAAGGTPIRTPKGWLVLYHGADEQERNCLGAVLLDIKDPTTIIARSENPLMEPMEAYEIAGLIPNKIIANGHLVIGDRVEIYYGGSEETVCKAELSINEILNSLVPK